MEIVGFKKLFKNEIKNNRMQKKENKNIMNMFLNNIKETGRETVQKKELPKFPVVPALLNKLPEAINNMIFHYVGYRSKVATRVTIEYINHYSAFSCIRLKQMKIASYIANMHFHLEKISLMEKRREALIKMPRWVQKYIFGTWFIYLFPKNNKENLTLLFALENEHKIMEASIIRDNRNYSKDFCSCYRDIKDNYNENENCDFID